MDISTSTDETRAMYMVLFDMLGNSQTLVERVINMTFQRAHPDYIQAVDLIHSEGYRWNEISFKVTNNH